MEIIHTSSVLNVAINAAREAGKIISQNIDKLDRIKLMQKDGYDIASEVDILAEKILIQELHKPYPDFSILSEESKPSEKKSGYCWVIDPLDGTFNFIHGHPHCCVSIGLTHKGETLVGVVLDPFRNELFTARKGAGAQLDGRRIRVSNVGRLSDSLIATGFPHPKHSSTKMWLKSYATILPRCQSIHRSGSSALDLAYVACGRYDGIWQYGLKQWDTIAGRLLIKEAGGLIHDFKDSDITQTDENLAAGNPKILEKLQHLLNRQ